MAKRKAAKTVDDELTMPDDLTDDPALGVDRRSTLEAPEDPFDDVSEGPRTWHRQPGETDSAWRAFQCYRSLPVGQRTQKAVTDRLYPGSTRMIRPGQRTGYSSHVDQYARDWRWKERVTALDQYLDQKADEVRIASLQADARDAIEYQRTLRANRAALAGRLRERIMAMATAVNSDGSAVAFDSNEAKAQRDVVLAVERLQLIEDGCTKGLEPVIAAYVAKAVPSGGTDAELPASIPPDVAASVLALLSAVGNAGE